MWTWLGKNPQIKKYILKFQDNYKNRKLYQGLYPKLNPWAYHCPIARNEYKNDNTSNNICYYFIFRFFIYSLCIYYPYKSSTNLYWLKINILFWFF